MENSLVIVESPAKAKTIGKYLGKQFVVKASLGHVKDLPKKNLSVDVDNDFKPVYEVIEGKKKLMGELRTAAKGVDNIYLAADPDREGEAICYHLQEELQTKAKDGPKFFRVMFNEITKNAIQKAFEKPLSVNLHLVDAQQARRILDRLVGYKISPLLWDKVRRGLSAGRVQTVALRLIVDREREIRAFQKREYWTIDVNLAAKKPPQLSAHLAKKDGENVEIANEAGAKSIVDTLDSAPYVVKSVVNKEKRRNPVPPFITSTLQQEAARKLRFSVKRTMMLAQRLYEGVELGAEEGSVGLISYMRTDSVRVSNEAVDEVRAMIEERYGADYRPEKPNFYKGKKDAQDAHEAVRPTSSLRSPESLAAFLDEDLLKLYRLIWMRFVASQMTPAVFDQTTIDVEATGKDKAVYLFRATGSVEKFKGFLTVYEEGKDAKDEEDAELKLKMPAVEPGETLKFKSIDPEQHFTEPPPRFTEATLVKELESDGVGRPSTYASILSTIQEREYVRKEGGKFAPTELGEVVTDLLLESFSDLFDVNYTARLEAELDEIEEGKIDWRVAMSEFYERFTKDLDHAALHMTDIKRMEEPIGEDCDKCGKPLVIKWGKNGKFIACTGYPECKNTRELPAAESGEVSEQDEAEMCDNCGRPMVLKKGRFGQFLACSGYPDCKTTKQLGAAQQQKDVPLEEKCPNCGNHLIKKFGRYGEFVACSNYPTCKFVKQKTIGVKCPNCSEGEVVERRSKRGKTFYGCNRYPDCDFVAWGKPIAEKCPQCGGSYMIEKYLKAGAFAQCPNDECKFKKPLEVVQAPVEAVV
jgi:DNA topoisomerase-1